MAHLIISVLSFNLNRNAFLHMYFQSSSYLTHTLKGKKWQDRIIFMDKSKRKKKVHRNQTSLDLFMRHLVHSNGCASYDNSAFFFFFFFLCGYVAEPGPVPSEPGHCRARKGSPWRRSGGVLQLHQQRWVILRIDSLALWDQPRGLVVRVSDY